MTTTVQVPLVLLRRLYSANLHHWQSFAEGDEEKGEKSAAAFEAALDDVFQLMADAEKVD